MINAIAIYMLSGTVLSSIIAAAKDRSIVFWAVFGIVAGPIAVAIVIWLPSRRPVAPPRHPPYAMRSIANDIYALDDMRQRGMITDTEFAQGKAQILAWPVTSPIPPALSPHCVIADGRRTWQAISWRQGPPLRTSHAVIVSISIGMTTCRSRWLPPIRCS